MLRIWATVTTVVNSALAVAGLGVAGYAAAAGPRFVFFYYGVALICVAGAAAGFVNLYFLNEAVRREEEKNRPARELKRWKKEQKAAKKMEKETAKAEKEAARQAARQAELETAQGAAQREREELTAAEEPTSQEEDGGTPPSDSQS